MASRLGSKILFYFQKQNQSRKHSMGILVSPVSIGIALLLLITLSLPLLAAPILGPSYRALPDDRQDYVPAELIKRVGNPKDLFLRSHVAVVYDERDNEVIFKRSANRKMPIASITKLMTAMVVIDGNLPMDEMITVRRVDSQAHRC